MKTSIVALLPRSQRSGFTLVELLGVIAVMLLLTSLSMPLVGDMLASRSTERAASELAGLVEMARREAVTLQTYTWVALEEEESEAGEKWVVANVRCSRIGDVKTSSSGGTSYINMEYVKVLSRTYRWPQVELMKPANGVLSADDFDKINFASSFRADSLPKSPLSGFASIQEVEVAPGRTRQQVVGAPAYTITFTPSGYAFLKANPGVTEPYSEKIGIAMKHSTRGGEALLTCDGLTGSVRVIR